MARSVSEKHKAKPRMIRKNILYRLIRDGILCFFFVIAVFRITFTAVTIMTTIAVLGIGQRQNDDLPIRKENSRFDTVRYIYDEQGRLKEAHSFSYTTLSELWPFTIIPDGMPGGSFKVVNPLPYWREVWEYEENSLNKTVHVYNSSSDAKDNFQGIVSYQYVQDDQGRTVSYERSVSGSENARRTSLIRDYLPEKQRYEYDGQGNLSVLYELDKNGTVYKYHNHIYKQDVLSGINIYMASDDSLYCHVQYIYKDGLLIEEEYHFPDEANIDYELRYAYDARGRFLSNGNYSCRYSPPPFSQFIEQFIVTRVRELSDNFSSFVLRTWQRIQYELFSY